MQRIPFAFAAEFRGVTKQAGQFTRRDTGQVVDAPARLQFEHRDEDGTLVPVEFSASAFDKITPPVDWAVFAPGDRMKLSGVCVLADKNSDRDSYATLVRVDVETGKAALKAA